jgi:hypothetical protein
MGRILVSLLATLSLTVHLSARPAHDWGNLEKLKRGTPILVLLWTGENMSGRVDAVNGTGLRLTPFERMNGGIGSVHEVERTNIERISTIHQHRLPDPRRWMIVGTVAGGAIGVTAGAVSDANHSGPSTWRWFTGGVAGAGFGFLGSVAALAGVGAFDIGSDIAHPRKVLYEGIRDHQAPPK